MDKNPWVSNDAETFTLRDTHGGKVCEVHLPIIPDADAPNEYVVGTTGIHMFARWKTRIKVYARAPCVTVLALSTGGSLPEQYFYLDTMCGRITCTRIVDGWPVIGLEDSSAISVGQIIHQYSLATGIYEFPRGPGFRT